MLLGCIGDDFTGSSDLANTLTKQGMSVTQYVGVPDRAAERSVEAGVVALKSRTIPADEAVRQSLDALGWLVEQGCEQFLFKYCSTFDSTPDGNIGPVIDALGEALGAEKIIVCPAFPTAGRTVYQGHLFVTDVLLNESGMENHPLTPMTDPDIRRWLKRQSRNRVGFVSSQTVLRGSDAVRQELQRQRDAGFRHIVVDAIQNQDLMEIGAASGDLKLITGGSGIALGLPENFRKRGLLAGHGGEWRSVDGPCAVLSGSCSRATRAQVAYHAKRHASREVDVDALMAGDVDTTELTAWLRNQEGVPLIYSSADPERVRKMQETHGREAAANAVERLFGEIAKRAVQDGVTRLIVAGGETSGAVVEALRPESLSIGPEIDPGVPMLRAGEIALALKSGNFGSEDFFEKTARMMEGK